MKALTFVLLVAALAVAVVAGGAGARPVLPELGMGGKRTVTPDVAGFAKQHGHTRSSNAQRSRAARTRTSIATIRSRTTSRTSRSTRRRPAI